MVGCASNGWGPSEIAWCDLQAWAAMTGNMPEPWECEALMRLSASFVRIRTPKKPATKST